jgi:hypothetical protein
MINSLVAYANTFRLENRSFLRGSRPRPWQSICLAWIHSTGRSGLPPTRGQIDDLGPRSSEVVAVQLLPDYLKSRPFFAPVTNTNKMSRFAPHKPSNSTPRATQDTVCQKCLGRGHYTFNCKAAAVPYRTRPSRTQMLENPDKFSGVPGGKRASAGGPSVELPEEFLSKCVRSRRVAQLRVFELMNDISIL